MPREYVVKRRSPETGTGSIRSRSARPLPSQTIHPGLPLSLDPVILFSMLTALVAGFVRGFTGFGGAMIFMPFAGALLTPQVAAPVLVVTDFFLVAPFLWKEFKRANWRSVGPAAAAALITTPIGAYLLATGDPVTLRWVISAIILSLLVLLISGLRYHGRPRALPSFGVGAAAGLCGGIGQITGPPVVAYWMSGPDPLVTTRANLFSFFALTGIISITAYFGNGLITAEVGWTALWIGPAYVLAFWLGGRLFHLRGGRGYRTIAYGTIVISVLAGLPLLDRIIRPGTDTDQAAVSFSMTASETSKFE